MLSVATLVLYFAYVGQAWNVMMGFAGQLSLGHSLYVGVGAYAAAALFFHYGIGPWAGVWLAIALCAALGAFIGFLAFRLRISGVLLRAADHRLRRVHAHRLRPPRLARRPGRHVPAGRGAEPRRPRSTSAARPRCTTTRCWRSRPARFGLCAFLLRRRAGYYWQAIREDEDAAQALGIDIFRWKMLRGGRSARR